MAFGFGGPPGSEDSGHHRPEFPSAAASNGAVPVDLYRQGDHYILNADLPGADPGSLEITLAGQLLTIRAHRTLRDFSGPGWMLGERGCGTVQRQVLLGTGINTDCINVQYNCGILSLLLPVKPEHRTRKIGVRVR